MLNCFGFSSVKSILIKAAALQLDALNAFDPVQRSHEFVRGTGPAQTSFTGDVQRGEIDKTNPFPEAGQQ